MTVAMMSKLQPMPMMMTVVMMMTSVMNMFMAVKTVNGDDDDEHKYCRISQ